MKRKWIALAAALLFISAAFASCHSTTPCPAYAHKHKTNNPDQENIDFNQKNLVLHQQ
ncbi:MAG: hypothetical protein ACQER7_02890 [Bacteroidota bacterium]